MFTLKNINIKTVSDKYNLNVIPSIKIDETPVYATDIQELKEPIFQSETISFLDEVKNNHKCKIIMIDFTHKKNISNSSIDIHCFWCRHKFKNSPIGCPIRYISSIATKTYFSETTKDKYSIKENITNKKSELFTKKNKHYITNNTNSEFSIQNGGFYETDSVFCSFNCCLAFIRDNRHNHMYDHSEFLLVKLYREIFPDCKDFLIMAAPSWKLLKEYGGFLTIEKFRETFNKITYIDHGIFKPIGNYIENTINF